MDITKTVISLREAALLYGDFTAYHTQLSGKLLNSRKKLGIATKNRGKFHPKTEITSDQIAENHEYVRLQLLGAERAWANAMAMKASHNADKKGVSGKTRSHIVSRLDKAAKGAETLSATLAQRESGASQTDILEGRAYASLLRGAAQFEKQSWQACLRSLSVARIIYSALSTSAKADIFKDLLSETIDPSIRYAAYQLKVPRSQPIPIIAVQAFPRSNSDLVERINQLNHEVLKHGDRDAKQGSSGPEATPTTLVWRNREVQIEDAAIAVAWAAVGAAKSRLTDKLSSSTSLRPKDMAAAYDDILTASQDAVDATKQAIDELKIEGVSQSDPRMQSLQITRTAVNYEMISWRIGRNRVLTGEQGGVDLNSDSVPRRKSGKIQQDSEVRGESPPGRQLARLKERVVLYDSSLQSLESIKELPGVAADEELLSQLDATFQYFNALKSLAIARSHSLAGSVTNALALMNYAYDQAKGSGTVLRAGADPREFSPRNILVTKTDVNDLGRLLQGELQRCRALVEISNVKQKPSASSAKSMSRPLVERLSHFPAEGVDLDNIVTYPPTVDPIPVKPLFLDVAWNYIDYPEDSASLEKKGKEQVVSGTRAAATEQESKPQKRGWFGFGR